MKKGPLIGLIILLSVICAVPVKVVEAGTGTNVGETAPDFTLKDTHGNIHTLSRYQGKVVLLYFAMWCSTCRSNCYEIQREIFLPFNKDGLQVFAVDYLKNEPKEVLSIIKDLSLRYPVLMDDNTLVKYYGSKMALTLVIDQKGIIRYKDFYEGGAVKRLVAELLGKKAKSEVGKKEDRITGKDKQACPIPVTSKGFKRQVFYGSSPEEYFGFAIPSSPLNLNRDGYNDLVIGTPSSDGNKGNVFIHYGGKNGVSPVPDITIAGRAPGDRFGFSLLGRDVDNDGYQDLIMGGNISRDTSGKVYIFPGSKDGILRKSSQILQGKTKGDWFGASLAMGDINGDGYAELIVGAMCDSSSGDRAGAVYIYYGGPDGFSKMADTIITGEGDFDYLGRSIVSADINGDGYPDILIGASGNNAGGVDRGAVYIFYGKKGKLPDRLHAEKAEVIIAGEHDMDGFGGEVAKIGDVNGDAHLDIAISASGSNKGGKRSGAVYLFLHLFNNGKRLSHRVNAGSADLILTEEMTHAIFGSSVAGMGDLNRDGIDDFAIGAMNMSGNVPRGGAVYIYFGNKEGAFSSPDETIRGNQPDGRFGRTVVSMGDINRDGIPDFLVSETGNSEKHKYGGAVYILSPVIASRADLECPNCGMDISKYQHTRYEVTATDGRKWVTCGVHCGLILQINLGDKFKSATATDFITGRGSDAHEMFYVYKSEAVPDMWPSFIAFLRRENAERFQKGFGGEVLTYEEALKKASLLITR